MPHLLPRSFRHTLLLACAFVLVAIALVLGALMAVVDAKAHWEVVTPVQRYEFCGYVYTDGDNPVVRLVYGGREVVLTGSVQATRLGPC